MVLLSILLGALIVGAVAFGVAALMHGADPGLEAAEPDGYSQPLPAERPLREQDFAGLRFDRALRGYRMTQVDTAIRRSAYDIGYKEELIAVLEAEVAALRQGNREEADRLQRARIVALQLEPVVPDESREPDEARIELTVTPADVEDATEPADATRDDAAAESAGTQVVDAKDPTNDADSASTDRAAVVGCQSERP